MYKAMVNPFGGACWAHCETKGGAMMKLKAQLRRDWGTRFDIDAWLASGIATCDLYKDMGTESHLDDEYIATVPLI